MTTTAGLQQIAATIRDQITPGVLMSLGAHKLGYINDDEEVAGGLRFVASILPFNKNGERAARPRLMTVVVTLTYADLYDISVVYPRKHEAVTHYQASGVYCYQLAKLLLALDWDGDEILNPRYA